VSEIDNGEEKKKKKKKQKEKEKKKKKKFSTQKTTTQRKNKGKMSLSSTSVLGRIVAVEGNIGAKSCNSHRTDTQCDHLSF
jgi:hypothetical protein